MSMRLIGAIAVARSSWRETRAPVAAKATL